MNKKAFSIIELTIVLIVIGLIVAGVTGGSSLIQSSRILRLQNEFAQYQQAVFAFETIKARLPGDINETGFIGYKCESAAGCVSAYTYASGNFPAPYNSRSYFTTNGPYIELYLEKLIDFKPKETATSSEISVPKSKAFSNEGFYFYSFGDYCKNNLCQNSEYLRNIAGESIFLEGNFNDIYELPTEIVQKFDQKYDDGIFNSGKIRGRCAGDPVPLFGPFLGYDDPKTKICTAIFYKMK